MRTFSSGATRDDDTDKIDYEGFLSPLTVEAFAMYMHHHRKQADGKLRDSDNWQKGIDKDAYMKSLFRHFMDLWKAHRGVGAVDKVESLCALWFNVQGYLLEELKELASATDTPEGKGFDEHMLNVMREEVLEAYGSNTTWTDRTCIVCGAREGTSHKEWCGHLGDES